MDDQRAGDEPEEPEEWRLTRVWAAALSEASRAALWRDVSSAAWDMWQAATAEADAARAALDDLMLRKALAQIPPKDGRQTS